MSPGVPKSVKGRDLKSLGFGLACSTHVAWTHGLNFIVPIFESHRFRQVWRDCEYKTYLVIPSKELQGNEVWVIDR